MSRKLIPTLIMSLVSTKYIKCPCLIIDKNIYHYSTTDIVYSQHKDNFKCQF